MGYVRCPEIDCSHRAHIRDDGKCGIDSDFVVGKSRYYYCILLRMSMGIVVLSLLLSTHTDFSVYENLAGDGMSKSYNAGPSRRLYSNPKPNEAIKPPKDLTSLDMMTRHVCTAPQTPMSK
jgi:hypothetical protein